VGIIDSTAYIDDNAYANDETTQFMNDVFVNNPLAQLPSYDLGGVIQIEKENLTVKGLVMNTKNDQGQDYDYYAVQLGYSLNVPSLGSGNYRIYYYRTTKDFENYQGERDYIEGIGLSLDQELNQYLGSFLRLGLNTNQSTGDYKNLLSGGVQLSGNLWNRSKDIFAVGWAYLDGNSKVSGIKNSIVGEAYYKIPLTEYSDLTLDGQYYTEKHTDQSLGAWALALRLNVSF
jgi:porin